MLDSLRSSGPAVVTIPHDRTLATGGDVDLNDLMANTQPAYLQLAAVVRDGVGNPRPDVW